MRKVTEMPETISKKEAREFRERVRRVHARNRRDTIRKHGIEVAAILFSAGPGSPTRLDRGTRQGETEVRERWMRLRKALGGKKS
jgi:hypothetical protein